MTSARLIAITGATGFIGRYLVRELTARGYKVRILLRQPSSVPLDCSSAVIGDLARPKNTREAFESADAVIHTAGVNATMTGVPEHDFRNLNTEATIGLARSAFASGVKRFVFLSSVRAQAGPSAPSALTEADVPQPTDPYGRSKLAAEQGLATLNGDWVALRLASTYGAGVSGNFAELMRLALSPYPLPFAGLSARRSILSLPNLLSAIEHVLKWTEPLRRPLLVADPEPLTIAEIIAAMRRALGRRAGLFPVPAPVLKAAFAASGRSEAYRRLAEPLVVRTDALRALGWVPPLTSREGLVRLVQGGGLEARPSGKI
jgi:UDP-glucose 4-epimerase